MKKEKTSAVEILSKFVESGIKYSSFSNEYNHFAASVEIKFNELSIPSIQEYEQLYKEGLDLFKKDLEKWNQILVQGKEKYTEKAAIFGKSLLIPYFDLLMENVKNSKHEIKNVEQMIERFHFFIKEADQLEATANDVTILSPQVSPPTEPTLPRGQLAKEEERKGIITFRPITNDGSKDAPIILTGLKNIYQKQLPKMPKEYIARLVFDRSHASMAIVKKGLNVVGGITYRLFPEKKFCEIVFCAITSSEQVKGYGSHLMSHLKSFIRKTTDAEHFLTYADNYAVGYFKKQGFTADIDLDRSIWAGGIKDYEGGTIMQCTMVPKIEYLEVADILKNQKMAINNKLKKVLQDTTDIYPGLFQNGESSINPEDIPGLVDFGWRADLESMIREADPLYPLLRQLLSDIQSQTHAWPFREPVDADQVPGYYEIIENPIDLKTMDNRVENHYYKSLDSFVQEFMRMCENCRKFNDAKSVYVKCANKLESFFRQRMKVVEESNVGVEGK